MRVMHVITDLTIGGAQSMLHKLLSASSADFESAVVSLAHGGPVATSIAALGVPVQSLDLSRKMPNPFAALKLRKITHVLRPHLIQGWLYHGNLAASLAGWRTRPQVPVLWNIRQSLDDTAVEKWTTQCIIHAGAHLSRGPEAIIYNSFSGARQHQVMGYDGRKREIIPNGFDCQLFRPDPQARSMLCAELGLRNDTVLVGLVARFHPVKGQTTFLEAAGLVARQCDQARFVLIGPGVTREEPVLARLVTEQRLEDRVFLLGSRCDIPRLTAALDIACSTSSNEGFSNSIAEAMSCGVPCVVTDVGDSAYLVADAGLCVPSRNPAAVAEGIIQVIRAGPERRQQLGKAARRRVEDEFSLPVVVRRYEDLYREHLLRI
jgi:glycosyltransferase involved in cell wall biosynthesis